MNFKGRQRVTEDVPTINSTHKRPLTYVVSQIDFICYVTQGPRERSDSFRFCITPQGNP